MTCRCEAFCINCGVHVAGVLEMHAVAELGCGRCGAPPGCMRRLEALGKGRTFNPTASLHTGDGQRVCLNCLRGERSGHAWTCTVCDRPVPNGDDGLPAELHPHAGEYTLRCVVTFN